MDTVSNGGFLPFAAALFYHRCPMSLAANTVLRLRCSRQLERTIRLSVAHQSRNPLLARALNGWQVSGTAFWHSGLPFFGFERTILRERKWHCSRERPAVCQRCTGRAALPTQFDCWCHATRNHPVAQPGRFVSTIDPSTGACAGGDSPVNCQFGNLGRNALRWSDFVWSDLYLTKWFQLSEHVKLRIDGQFFNVFNHPNFWPPQPGLRRDSGQALHPNRIRRAQLFDLAANWTLGSRIGRRQFSTDDCVSSSAGILRRWCEWGKK